MLKLMIIEKQIKTNCSHLRTQIQVVIAVTAAVTQIATIYGRSQRSHLRALKIAKLRTTRSLLLRLMYLSTTFPKFKLNKNKSKVS
jgi:hypothetical protein